MASSGMLRSAVACPKYRRAAILGSSRCGLVGLSVNRPPPWKEATAAILSGRAQAIRIANAPEKQYPATPIGPSLTAACEARKSM